MVIEDNASTRTSMRRCLEGAGFSVIEAPDGKTALEQAATARPALIAQDMHLPDIDGFDLLEQLRTMPGLAEIPIIAVTGFLPERTTGTAEFNDVLIKPVMPSQLIKVISALVLAPVIEQPVHPARHLVPAEDEAVRRVMQRHLSDPGFSDQAANDAEARLAGFAGRHRRRQLVIPELNGRSLRVAVRRDPVLADVLIVLVTSAGEPDRAAHA
jgi:CheY-like chemotaxis protein